MLFDVFPTIKYDGNYIRNIFIDVNSMYQELVNGVTLTSYTIQEYPRPEVLSKKLYGSTQYEWTFLVINKITDPYHGWLKTEDQVYETATLLYPVTNENPNGIDGIHHFIDPDDNDYIYYDLVYFEGQVEIPPDPESEEPGQPFIAEGWYHKNDIEHNHLVVQANLVPITNIEYELEENEKKRHILIIPPAQISKFLDATHRLINERYNKKY